MVLTDLVMPNMSGLEFLEKVKKLLPRTEVAVMTGHGSVETAVQAMKLGAYDYISKPFAPLEELRLFLRRMGEKITAGGREPVSAGARGYRDRSARNCGRLGQDSGCSAHDFTAERHAHAGTDYRGKRYWKGVSGAGHPFPRLIR